ncbi:MAG: hypothetical protein B7Z22_08115, partial [Hyphomonas sp. 32-62-5]
MPIAAPHAWRLKPPPPFGSSPCQRRPRWKIPASTSFPFTARRRKCSCRAKAPTCSPRTGD